MKVALYARVSTDEQENKNQLEALYSYVKLKPDWEIYNVYQDKITGSTDKRTDLDKLMQDARKGLFDHIVFWKVDRLARKSLIFYQILEEWTNLGITYSITTVNIDTSTAWGKFVVGLLQQVAELEREFIKERTQQSINRIKKELKENKIYITKSGKEIKKLGRPKGSTDKGQRRKSGYHKRWSKEEEIRRQKHRMKEVKKSPPENDNQNIH
jgi:DNA invertase Pin-like site-specific DNA recombinase